MKNKKLSILLLVLGVVVIVAGVYFLTKDNFPADIPDDVVDDDQAEPEEPVESEEPSEPDQAEEDSDIAIGKPAPELKYTDKDNKEVELMNLDGDIVRLEDYKGKIVLLNFWGTWCKWCDTEMPDLDKLDKENEDLVVLAVNVQEGRDQVQKYIDEGGYDFEVVLDTEGQIAAEYLVSSFPLSFFLDKEGLFVLGYPGAMDYETMESVLDEVRDRIK